MSEQKSQIFDAAPLCRQSPESHARSEWKLEISTRVIRKINLLYLRKAAQSSNFHSFPGVFWEAPAAAFLTPPLTRGKRRQPVSTAEFSRSECTDFYMLCILKCVDEALGSAGEVRNEMEIRLDDCTCRSALRSAQRNGQSSYLSRLSRISKFRFPCY